MRRKDLAMEMERKKSFLCVGIDPDLDKLPIGVERSAKGVLEFSKRIIDATQDYAVAYKLNTAFYEVLGASGWEAMQETLEYIPNNCLKIADAKRGDIGNTAAQYTKAFFDTLQADAVTLNPYMGLETLEPFAAYSDKWLIVLGLTSNTGSADVETQMLANGKMVYEEVMAKVSAQFSAEQLMWVMGATKPEAINQARALYPDHAFLVPGVGAQGGDLATTISAGRNAWGGLLINSSREIIYASNGADFAEAAGRKAQEFQAVCAELWQTLEVV